jgi:hypothetical protein
MIHSTIQKITLFLDSIPQAFFVRENVDSFVTSKNSLQ